jgi:hypothetical protein
MSYLDKIKELEEKKKELIEKRKNQIVKIIEKTNTLTLDDDLIANLLFFASAPENKDHTIFSEIKAFAKLKNFSLPSKRKKNPK